MTDFNISSVASFEEFTQVWSEANDDIMQLLWQLLGQIDEEETLVQIPEWLAEEKVGYVEGAAPTEVVGRIERETEKAILLDDATAAKPLMKLAHRIHELEQNEDESDRRDWLDNRLAKHRRKFEKRENVPELADGWLPKSQIHCAVRRRSKS